MPRIMRFQDARMSALSAHLVCTTGLIWTRYPSVQITLKPGYSAVEYTAAENAYLSAIAFGIIFLVLEALLVYLDQGRISLRSVLSMVLDIASCFFLLWIMLDGLAWDTYYLLFFFCVMLPFIWSFTFHLPEFYAQLYLFIKATGKTIWYGLNYCYKSVVMVLRWCWQ